MSAHGVFSESARKTHPPTRRPASPRIGIKDQGSGKLRTNPLELSAVVSALRKLRVTTDACGREATSRQRSMTARSMS